MPKNKREPRNRRERKASYMKLKNKMKKYPDCAYNGDFWCNHIYDPANPWVWVDFSFFHTSLKRYYACAMVTAEYEAYNQIQDKAIEIAYTLFPTPYGEDILDAGIEPNSPLNKSRDDLMKSIIEEELEKPSIIMPSISVKDYGPVAIGLWVTVNKQHIDEHIIREFIAEFRALGEPITPGWRWNGEEIQVNPAKFFGTYAA